MFRFNKENKFQGRHRFLLAGTLCLLAVCFLMAQDKKPQHDKKAQPEQKVEPEKAQGKKKTRVDLLHAIRDRPISWPGRCSGADRFGQVAS